MNVREGDRLQCKRCGAFSRVTAFVHKSPDHTVTTSLMWVCPCGHGVPYPLQRDTAWAPPPPDGEQPPRRVKCDVPVVVKDASFRCPRCSCFHQATFKQFIRPPDEGTHWALCPETGEPIIATPKAGPEESRNEE